MVILIKKKKPTKKTHKKKPCHRKTIFTKMMKTSILKQKFMFYMKIKDLKKCYIPLP